MSNKLPLFASAPLCTIEINNKRIAYAVGLSLNVGINLQEIRVLGQFELESIEPLAMMPVTGSFQVIRLITEPQRVKNVQSAKDAPNSLVRTANEVGTLTGLAKPALFSNSTESEQGTGALTGSAELAKHLDPRTILLSQTFDISIKMKVPSVYKEVEKVKQWVQGEETVFMEIIDCRLSGASANIAPGALLTESVEFQGLIAIRKKPVGGKDENVEAPSIKVKDL